MILSRKRWYPVLLDEAPAVVAEMPCGHEVFFFKKHITPEGKIVGRPQCTVQGCRKVHDELVLEGWEA